MMSELGEARGQVSACVTDIRGPQRCGAMSAERAPRFCDEARTDMHGGPNVTRQAETGGMIKGCGRDGDRREETRLEGKKGAWNMGKEYREEKGIQEKWER